MVFYNLQVCRVVKETNDSTSFYFHIPFELIEVFKYKAGQFLTLKVKVRDVLYKRAYSICTAPYEETLGITVKRVLGGKVSNYLNDNINEGDFMDVSPPTGYFTNNPAPGMNYLLVAAGSGITPIMSILKDVLHNSNSDVILLYGSKHPEETIYLKELLQLEKYYSNFSLFLSYSQHVSEGKYFEGRINQTTLQTVFLEHLISTKQSKSFVCGPNPLIELVFSYWKDHNKQGELLYEKFSLDDKSDSLYSPNGKNTPLNVTLDGENYGLLLEEGQTILSAMLLKNIDTPYSCGIGNCSTCIAKVLKGAAKMYKCETLDEEEIETGYVLTCQAYATSEELIISFDN
jgi:ring-1,2-phenylacetyl-CoA epoxidase subunit PaaE